MASFLKTLTTRSSSSSTPRFLPQQTNPLKFKNLIFLPPKSMASWSCSQCTFHNSPSQKSTCQICQSTQPHTLTDPPSSSSPSKPKWSCKACTFLNSYRNNNCEICGTRASSASLLSTLETCDDDELDSSVGSVFLPLKACSKRKIREAPAEILDDDDVDTGGFHGIKRKNREIPAELLDDAVGSGPSGGVRKSANKSVAVLDETQPSKDLKMLKILSYNVWFREDLEMHKRMKALGDLIQLHSPDLICLQEVTPNIYDIFQQSGWWKLYKCSISNEMAFTRPYFCMQLSKLPVKSFCCKAFRNSMMGRELCVADVAFEEDTPLVIATSHLESPCLGPPTWDQTFSKERVDQAKEAFDFLKTNTNVIFCGDMNWDDKSDGKVPLPEGWIDAWTELRPGEIGWTYDTKSNMMLSGNRTLQKRLDRFLCCLRDFKIDQIEMIGMEAIPGLSYSKEKKVRKEVKTLVLPVLPSDHYGLLLTIRSQ